MAQVVKSTKDFELFGGLNPGTVRGCVWHDNQLVSESLTIA